MQDRFYTFNQYLKEVYGEKIYKVSLNGGMTCPNRDGTVGTGGCIFCSEGGSGDFASSPSLSIYHQIEAGKELLQNKSCGNKFIAYFQAFTNTYAPVTYLETIYQEAIAHPDIVGLAIGTRPDCLDAPVLNLLSKLNAIKPVFIELGLQTIHPSTADFIRRGYPLSCFESAVKQLHGLGINIIVHLIVGLPGETKPMILESIDYLNKLPINGIKLTQLHILKNTDLAQYYLNNPFPLDTLEEYTDFIVTCIANLRPDIVIHRITGDGPKSLLIEPKWSQNKKLVLNTIHHKLKLLNIYQGQNFEG